MKQRAILFGLVLLLGSTALYAEDVRIIWEAKEGESSGTIHGTLYYLGKPIHEYTAEQPSFFIAGENEPTVANLTPSLNGSTYKFDRVPLGIYYVQVSLGAQPGTTGALNPGAYYGSVDHVRLEQDGQDIILNFHLVQMMRLRKPIDNTRMLSEKLRLRSPVEFVWDPLPGATRYEAKIYRWNEKMGGPFVPVDFKSTQSSTWTVKLNKTQPGYSYYFMLDAFAEDQPIGSCGVADPGGRGPLVFTVE